MLLTHQLTAVGLRYAITGVIVGVVYIGTPVVLNGGFGVPVEVAIPLAYLVAITLHFNLQRHFVFRHISSFALSARQQIGRYVIIGAVQYPTTAIATAVLPSVLGLSQRITYVVVTLTMSLGSFLLLRTHIFHPQVQDLPSMEGRLGSELEVAELEFLVGAGVAGERDADAVQPPVDERR